MAVALGLTWTELSPQFLPCASQPLLRRRPCHTPPTSCPPDRARPHPPGRDRPDRRLSDVSAGRNSGWPSRLPSVGDGEVLHNHRRTRSVTPARLRGCVRRCPGSRLHAGKAPGRNPLRVRGELNECLASKGMPCRHEFRADRCHDRKTGGDGSSDLIPQPSPGRLLPPEAVDEQNVGIPFDGCPQPSSGLSKAGGVEAASPRAAPPHFESLDPAAGSDVLQEQCSTTAGIAGLPLLKKAAHTQVHGLQVFDDLTQGRIGAAIPVIDNDADQASSHRRPPTRGHEAECPGAGSA